MAWSPLDKLRRYFDVLPASTAELVEACERKFDRVYDYNYLREVIELALRASAEDPRAIDVVGADTTGAHARYAREPVVGLVESLRAINRRIVSLGIDGTIDVGPLMTDDW